MFRYTMECFETRSLTDKFTSAKIRLIPKQGASGNAKELETHQSPLRFVQNYLTGNCERLHKYMDKLTRVSQRGFSSSKQCQEVLINPNPCGWGRI